MTTLFDSLVDVTLGVTAPIAPITPPAFATPATQPYELEVVVEGEAPRRAPTARRAAHAAAEATAAAVADPPHATLPPAPTRTDAMPAPPRAATRPSGDDDPLVPLRWAYRWSPAAAHAPARAGERALEAPALRETRSPSGDAGGGDGGGDGGGGDEGDAEAPAPRAARKPATRDARTTPPGRRRETDERRPDATGETVVKVTIGRVDVRAVHAREPARTAGGAPAKAGPSLGDYLRDRSPRGGR